MRPVVAAHQPTWCDNTSKKLNKRSAQQLAPGRGLTSAHPAQQHNSQQQATPWLGRWQDAMATLHATGAQVLEDAPCTHQNNTPPPLRHLLLQQTPHVQQLQPCGNPHPPSTPTPTSIPTSHPPTTYQPAYRAASNGSDSATSCSADTVPDKPNSAATSLQQSRGRLPSAARCAACVSCLPYGCRT